MKRIIGWAGAALVLLAGSASAQPIIGPNIVTPPLPPGKYVFSPTLDETRQYSAAQNFEVVGHEYFKIPQRQPFAKAQGRPGPEIGGGFNTVRVYDGIAYLAGYNSPDTINGIVLADVRDPAHIKTLAFIPCKPGTRCTYLRVNPDKKLLMFGNDTFGAPGAMQTEADFKKGVAGWSIYDVSNPSKPKELSFLKTDQGALTHGMDADDRYIYGCRQAYVELGKARDEGLQIIDYSDPKNPRQVGEYHVPGQLPGEARGPLDMLGPDGKVQKLSCHEVTYYNDRLYIAWRDAGMKILDIKDRSKPTLVATYDYVPPFHGGSLGAAHTVTPVVTKPGDNPDLVVVTDEIFSCPTGTGRVVDISDTKDPTVLKGQRPPNPMLLSTFRIAVQDNFDSEKQDFICKNQTGSTFTSTHLPWFDYRSPSLLYVSWYSEGLRAADLSNPYVPTFIGYYLSPDYKVEGGTTDRRTREIYQDPKDGLIYVTDGGGGGLTVLRYTGPIPKTAPLPGAR